MMRDDDLTRPARADGRSTPEPAGAAGPPGDDATRPGEHGGGLADGPGPATGTRLAGRYRLGRLLGAGGMGEVYEAHDDDLGIRVALKVLRLASGDREGEILRLKQEVLLARAISHPCVCRTFDLGKDGAIGALGETVWFLTMELVEGETLRDRIRRLGPLPAAEARALAGQIISGLAAAHHAGIAHLDFKSANVMVAEGQTGPRALITDFGLARTARSGFADPDGPAVTWTGTPAYMAPEQIRGEAVGPAADLYALGVVLFEMVTGRLPHTGASVAELFARRLDEDPPIPSDVHPGTDPVFDRVVRCCLARDPRERYARAEEVAEALSQRGASAGKLPEVHDEFFGRQGELEQIRAHFDEGARLVTLVAPGGMGKTRLALEAARASTLSGGAWFCDLSEARDLPAVVAHVAGAFGLPLGRGDAVERIGAMLAGRGPCLVVLDNFEQVAVQADATVGRWCRLAPEARFLATSRERLRLEIEVAVVLEPLGSDPAEQLFLARARRHRPGFAPGAAELEQVREIVRIAERMPLAIELAAARVRVLTPSQIAERLHDRFRVLGGAAGRQGSLRRVIDTSWELLSRWERTAFAQCALFEGGFTLAAAESVIELSPRPVAVIEGAMDPPPGDEEPPWLIDLLQSLVDKSFLRLDVPEPLAGEDLPEARFSVFLALQEYGRERLREGGSLAQRQAEERHARWCAELARSARTAGQLERDIENLYAAARGSLARDDLPTAVDLFRGIAAVAKLRGPFGRAIEMGKAILDRCETPEHRLQLLVRLTNLEQDAGNLEPALRQAREAAGLARESGNRPLEARALYLLGVTCRSLGNAEEMEGAFEATLQIARAEGLREYEGRIDCVRGQMLMERGQPEEGRRALENALAIAREIADRATETVTLGALGAFHMYRNEIPEARSRTQAARDLARLLGDQGAEATYEMNLGILDRREGRPDDALARYEAALHLNRRLGHRRQEGMVYANIGTIHQEAGRQAEGRANFERALAIFRETAQVRFQGIQLLNIAAAWLVEQRADEAEGPLDEGEALLREAGDPSMLAYLLTLRAQACLLRNDPDGARQWLAEAERLAADAGEAPQSPLMQRLSEVRGMFRRDTEPGAPAN